MKKILLVAAATAAISPAFAQDLSSRSVSTGSNEISLENSAKLELGQLDANKTAGVTDTFYLVNDSMANGIARGLYADYALPADSGYFYGTSVYEYKGAAQVYYTIADASGNNDTTVQILGFYSKWIGHITNASKQVTFTVWKRGTNKVAVTGRNKFYIYGTPSSVSASRSVTANTLKLDGSGNFNYLSTPLSGVNYNIYAGYTQTYNWSGLAGDTIAPRITLGGYSNRATIEAGTADTLVDARTLLQDKNGNWKSVAFQLGLTNGGDVIIAPIYRLSCPQCGLGVDGIRRGGLSFFGNFPNPAVNQTSLKFSLANATGVTCTVYDATGRLLRKLDFGKLAAGEHVQPISVDGLSAGNYVYVLETSNGDVMAAQMTVAK